MAGNAIVEQGVYFSGGTPENSVDVTPYAPGLLGKEVTLNVGTVPAPIYRTYKYVKAGGAISVMGCGLEWSSNTTIGNTVIVSTVHNAPARLFAGWNPATSAIASGSYFWMVTYAQPKPFIAVLGVNLASNATQSDTGLYWNLSAGSMATTATVWSASQFSLGSSVQGILKGPLAYNLSSLSSVSASALNSTRTASFLVLA